MITNYKTISKSSNGGVYSGLLLTLFILLLLAVSEVHAQTALPKPPAPTGLEVTSANGTSIGLSWTASADDGSGAIEGYNLYRCDESSSSDCSDFPWLAWVAVPGNTEYTDTTVTTGTTYRYAVAAYRHDGTTEENNSSSVWSNIIAQTAPVALPQPPAPTGLEVTSANGTSIGLSWTASADDGSGAIEGYNIYRCDESSSSDCSDFPWLAWVAAADGTAYTDAAVTSGTTYRYAVSAYRHDGTTEENNSSSVWSNIVAQTAPVALPQPPAPTGLEVTSANGTSIGLSWTASADDGSGAIEGYNIYRCDESSSSDCSDFPWLAWVAVPGNTEYTDTTVTTGTTYRYAVAAYRHDGTTEENNSSSVWSNIVAQTAPVALPQPPAPTGLEVTSGQWNFDRPELDGVGRRRQRRDRGL